MPGCSCKPAVSHWRICIGRDWLIAKAGVHLLEITSADALQADLFTSAEDEARANQLMITLDRVNARFGSGTLQPGVAGLQEPRGWAMKRGNK
jgi:DNA polymerase V